MPFAFIGAMFGLGAYMTWMITALSGGGIAVGDDIEPLERYVCAQDEERAEEFDIECEED